VPSGIAVIDRIVIAVTVQVQAVDGGGVEVGSAVGADKAAPFWGIVPGVAVVQTGFFVVVVATGTTNGTFTPIESACLFYHFLCLQSRKSHPGHNYLGDFA
jgi:hypothetical protein